ncbi:MAG TPA: DUF4836 family protein [Chitinophagaceae bacterium]
MKMRTLPIACLLMLVLFAVSCSKKSDVPVPADAAFVLHIDGASLNSKLSWEEVQQSEWYKIANERTTDSFAKKVLSDPSNSGIDIKSDIYLFVKKSGHNGYLAVVGNVKDEKAFSSSMSKVMEVSAPTKEGELSVIRKDNNVITWKGNRFVLVASNPGMRMDSPLSGMEGPPSNQPGLTPDSLVKFANEVYAMKGENSVGTDKRFTDLLSRKGDAHFWVNGGNLYSGALPAAMALTKAELLFKGNVTGAVVNFENGKISIDAKSYYNKELAALYKKYSMKNLDEAMFKMIPSQNVAAVFAMNYPPEGLKEFVSLLGLDGLINMFLSKEGFSLDEFIRANKGEVMLSVSDFGVTSTLPYSTDTTMPPGMYKGMQKPTAKILFAASVNDKAAFQKMIDILKNTLTKEGGASANAMASKIPYQLKDNWFIAGSDSASVFSFGTTATEQPFVAKFRGHPIGGFIDIQKFITGARPMMDSTALIIADESLKTWQDVVFYGGEFKNDATETHMEISMVDKNTNSLKQLNNYFGVVARVADAQEKQRKLDRENYPTIDSVVAPRPAPKTY